MNTEWSAFLKHEDTDNARVDFKCIYVDMAGDLVAGLLLSQIVYWNLPSREGKSKLRVQREGNWWLAKKYEDWYGECRISEKQARRAVEILEAKGLIATAVFRFAGSPTTHLRLIPDSFLASWNEHLTQPGGDQEPPENEAGQMDVPYRAEPSALQGGTSTETTTENTTEPSPVASAPVKKRTPAKSGVTAGQREVRNEIRSEVERHITELSGLVPPANQRAAGALWWSPIREMCELGGWDAARVNNWCARAVQKMRHESLTISSPKSLLNVVRALAAEEALANKEPVASSGGKPWWADGGSLRLPVQTQHGRGNGDG